MFYNDNSQHTTSIFFKFLCYHLHLCHPIPACDIFPPKKMSDPFRPWVRPCACVGSGPKKIGRSVVAPEVPVGCHQPTPPPTYRPPELVTTINNGLVYQCLSMLDFRETCWTKKNDRRKSFKLSVVASSIKYMFTVVVKMIDLPQFPG